MTGYAFDEVEKLLKETKGKRTLDNPKMRYLCALFAELPYYHIPQWEIEDDPGKRLKYVRYGEYGNLIRRRISINLTDEADSVGCYLMSILRRVGDGEPQIYVVETEKVIAVLVVVDGILFIGFRGCYVLLRHDDVVTMNDYIPQSVSV